MPVIAIVGAGQGLGKSIAQVFGEKGFSVALVARDKNKLEALAAELGAEGIEAAGFAGDITDTDSLSAAFAAIKERFGTVDVLEFSPAPKDVDFTPLSPLDVTIDALAPEIDYYLYGGVRAAQQVLPEMLASGSGTLLFTTGAGSVTPNTAMGAVNSAAAALRNWVINLNQAAADKGVYAAHVAINAWIGSGAREAEASTIAKIYWDLYTTRDRAELVYTA